MAMASSITAMSRPTLTAGWAGPNTLVLQAHDREMSIAIGMAQPLDMVSMSSQSLKSPLALKT